MALAVTLPLSGQHCHRMLRLESTRARSAGLDDASRWSTSRRDEEVEMSREYTRRLAHALLGTIGTLCMATAGLAQDVSYNAMPGGDFAKYKSYKWVAIDGAEKTDQILDQQLKQAIDAQLATKGLSKSTGDTADLLVGYQVAVDQEKEW